MKFYWESAVLIHYNYCLCRSVLQLQSWADATETYDPKNIYYLAFTEKKIAKPRFGGPLSGASPACPFTWDTPTVQRIYLPRTQGPASRHLNFLLDNSKLISRAFPKSVLPSSVLTHRPKRCQRDTCVQGDGRVAVAFYHPHGTRMESGMGVWQNIILFSSSSAWLKIFNYEDIWYAGLRVYLCPGPSNYGWAAFWSLVGELQVWLRLPTGWECC